MQPAPILSTVIRPLRSVMPRSRPWRTVTSPATTTVPEALSVRPIFASIVAISLTLGAASARAQDSAARVINTPNAQVSTPVGVTLVVKKITVGEDATVVNLVVSFDSRLTGKVDLNRENAVLVYGDNQRLHLRQPTDNRHLSIQNGRSMAGDLVFPGQIPAGAEHVTLIFNEGNTNDDITAPGVTIEVPLTGAR